MSNRTIVVVTTSTLLPPGETFSGVQLTVEGPTPSTQLLVSPYSVVLDLAVGDYTLTAQAMNTDDKPVGVAASRTYTVAPDVFADIPVSITI